MYGTANHFHREKSTKHHGSSGIRCVETCSPESVDTDLGRKSLLTLPTLYSCFNGLRALYLVDVDPNRYSAECYA